MCLTAAAAAGAEPALDSVTVEARAEPGRPVAVSMSYSLRPAGRAAVAFTALRFADSRAANVRAFVGERELSFRTSAASESRVDGRVELPAAAAGSDRLELRLVYEVLPEPDLAAELLTLAVPLLVVEWPPAETRPETFQATVHLPPGVTAHAAFPSEYARVESFEPARGASAYRFELPVVPALIRLRAGTGRPPLITVERAADAVAVALLLGLAAGGWRRLREALE